jgi:hypothetical protein
MSKNNFRSEPIVVKRDENGEIKSCLKNATFKDMNDEHFLSILTTKTVKGPNPNLAKGPKDELLL